MSPRTTTSSRRRTRTTIPGDMTPRPDADRPSSLPLRAPSALMSIDQHGDPQGEGTTTLRVSWPRLPRARREMHPPHAGAVDPPTRRGGSVIKNTQPRVRTFPGLLIPYGFPLPRRSGRRTSVRREGSVAGIARSWVFRRCASGAPDVHPKGRDDPTKSSFSRSS